MEKNVMRQAGYRLLLVVLLVLGITTVSFAQEAPVIHQPITKSGSAAMEFGFGGLSTLSMPGVLLASFLLPGEGASDAIPLYAAGGKYYLADQLALRAFVGFSTSTSGADSIGSGKNTGTFFGIGVGVELHTHDVYSVSPYFGGQLSFASGSSNTTKKDSETLLTTETKRTASGFGIGVMAGFDWYVFNAVAIGCEYGLSFSSASGSTTVGGTTTDAPSSTLIAISSANIHLLIHM